MKKVLFITSLIYFPVFCYGQKQAPPDLDAYFSAIIVNDIDTDIDWYTNTLGFGLVNKTDMEERGFKQANLKRGEILIELIELDSAVNPKDVIPGYNAKTKITGLFKFGFLVTDFDRWMEHLTKEKVRFNGSIVSDPNTGKKMTIIKDPDGNRIQIFER